MVVTNGDNKRNRNPELVRHSFFRGIFSRVARELGVDRSYVSRVASGQRRSPKIEAALEREIKRIEKLTGSKRPK